MAAVLLIFAGVAFLIGLGMFGLARSAIHEIAGLVCLVIAAIFFSGAAIVDALRTLRKELREWGVLANETKWATLVSCVMLPPPPAREGRSASVRWEVTGIWQERRRVVS